MGLSKPKNSEFCVPNPFTYNPERMLLHCKSVCPNFYFLPYLGKIQTIFRHVLSIKVKGVLLLTMHMWGLIEVSSERDEKEEEAQVFQVFLEQFAQNEDNKNDKLF